MSYDALAADYHWLYDDVELRLGTSTPGARAVLAACPAPSRVADVACGIGIDAAALARRGFVVTATDGSEAMVRATRARLASEGLAAETLVASWDALPSALAEESFEVVLCTGNSIAHARNRSERVGAFTSFERLLAPGGLLVVDTHDWETIADWGGAAAEARTALERNGVTCLRRSRWRIGGDESGAHQLEIDLELHDPRRRARRSYTLSLHPFMADELRAEVRSAGLAIVTLDRGIDADRYTMVARKPSRAAG